MLGRRRKRKKEEEEEEEEEEGQVFVSSICRKVSLTSECDIPSWLLLSYSLVVS